VVEVTGVYFIAEGHPVPKQSTRFGNGHAYPDERVTAWQQVVSLSARQAMSAAGLDLLQGNLGASLTFMLGDRRRVDIDNLSKGVLDGCKGIVYEDDRQVMELHASKKHGSKVPSVHVHFWEVKE
jgi:Holliday junction resolvase RusA-like endonuclease